MAARRFSGEAEQRLCEEYLAGASTLALAERYSTEPITVSKTLKRNGITPRGACGRKPRQFSSEDVRAVTERYRAGETVANLARDYQTHYSRVTSLLRQEGVFEEDRPRNWKGGRLSTSGGYVQVLVRSHDAIGLAMSTATGYVMEHRLVMAHSLGRPLTKRETVHHINGDRADNRIGNLQLRSGNHGKGVVRRCACCGSVDIEEVLLPS